MSYETFRAIVWALGLPVIVYLSLQIARKLRAIRQRDAELREEEAQSSKDPYQRLAELYESQEHSRHR